MRTTSVRKGREASSRSALRGRMVGRYPRRKVPPARPAGPLRPARGIPINGWNCTPRGHDSLSASSGWILSPRSVGDAQAVAPTSRARTIVMATVSVHVHDRRRRGPRTTRRGVDARPAADLVDRDDDEGRGERDLKPEPHGGEAAGAGSATDVARTGEAQCHRDAREGRHHGRRGPGQRGHGEGPTVDGHLEAAEGRRARVSELRLTGLRRCL